MTTFNRYYGIIGLKESIGGKTGFEFNKRVAAVLKKVHKNNKFLATKQMGGDGGTDFIELDNNRYYAMYSGAEGNNHTKLKQKFESDLTQILTTTNKGKYTGKVERFTFIFNSFDHEKPNDPNNEKEQIVDRLQVEYGSFEWDFWNLEDLFENFNYDLDYDDVLALCMEFQALSKMQYESDTDLIIRMISEIDDVSDEIVEEKNYERKSTSNKIDINNLQQLKDIIDDRLYTSSFFKKMELVVHDENHNATFNKFKNKVILCYEKFASKGYHGVDLFNKIIDDIWDKYKQSRKMGLNICIYLFDRCDIFDN